MFMENETDREEYVLADFGYIWVGSARRNEGIPWQFGQVRDSLLIFGSFYKIFLSSNSNRYRLVHCTGFVQVMENLESHGILEFHFPGLESPEI